MFKILITGMYTEWICVYLIFVISYKNNSSFVEDQSFHVMCVYAYKNNIVKFYSYEI